MLQDFAASYNRTAGKAASRCVTVVIEQVNSGDAELALEQGWRAQSSERPDVWAPASSAWVNLLVTRVNELSILPSEPAQNLFYSPLVIGMPKPMADALGYPGKPVGWRDILRSSRTRPVGCEGTALMGRSTSAAAGAFPTCRQTSTRQRRLGSAAPRNAGSSRPDRCSCRAGPTVPHEWLGETGGTRSGGLLGKRLQPVVHA